MTLDGTSCCAPVSTRNWYLRNSVVRLIASKSMTDRNSCSITDPPAVKSSVLLHDCPSPTQLSRARNSERSHCHNDHDQTMVFRTG